MIANTNPSELQAVKARAETALGRPYDEVGSEGGEFASLVEMKASDLRALLLSHSEMEGEITDSIAEIVNLRGDADRMRSRIERLRAVLNGARAQFLGYAAEHDAKGTPEAAIKATVKRGLAETIRSALNEDQDHG